MFSISWCYLDGFVISRGTAEAQHSTWSFFYAAMLFKYIRLQIFWWTTARITAATDCNIFLAYKCTSKMVTTTSATTKKGQFWCQRGFTQSSVHQVWRFSLSSLPASGLLVSHPPSLLCSPLFLLCSLPSSQLPSFFTAPFFFLCSLLKSWSDAPRMRLREGITGPKDTPSYRDATLGCV